MIAKEKICGSENEKGESLVLTIHDLQTMADKMLVTLGITDHNTYVGVYVSTARMKRNEWRKLTKKLKRIGFTHLGGGNPWYGSIRDDTWRGPPYFDEPLGVATEKNTEKIQLPN